MSVNITEVLVLLQQRHQVLLYAYSSRVPEMFVEKLTEFLRDGLTSLC